MSDQVQKMRITISSAVVWRIIAELMRRHGTKHDIKVLQVHPGISIRGCYYLLFDAPLDRLGDATILILNLGGPSGTYSIRRKGAPETERERDFFFEMLGGDAVVFLDRIDGDLGLKTPKKLPPSTPAVLVARTIASCLEELALSPWHMRTTTAWVDASAYGPYIAAWTRHFLPDAAKIKAQGKSGELSFAKGSSKLCRFVALHPCGDSETSALDEMHEEQALALFDFQTGRVLLIADGKLVGEIDLPSEYEKQGRTLRAICSRLRGHLESVK